MSEEIAWDEILYRAAESAKEEYRYNQASILTDAAGAFATLRADNERLKEESQRRFEDMNAGRKKWMQARAELKSTEQALSVAIDYLREMVNAAPNARLANDVREWLEAMEE